MADKFRDGGVIAGSTSVTTYVYLQNVDGTAATGLSNTTTGLVVGYTQAGDTLVMVALAVQTPGATWISGGFCEVHATNAPGLYRIDWPNAAFAVGTEHVVFSVVAPALRPYLELVPIAFDPSLWQGTAATGTLTPTKFTTAGLPTLTAGQLNRRMLQVLSGACAGERVLIVGQSATNELQVAPPLTASLANGDRIAVL